MKKEGGGGEEKEEEKEEKGGGGGGVIGSVVRHQSIFESCLGVFEGYANEPGITLQSVVGKRKKPSDVLKPVSVKGLQHIRDQSVSRAIYSSFTLSVHPFNLSTHATNHPFRPSIPSQPLR